MFKMKLTRNLGAINFPRVRNVLTKVSKQSRDESAHGNDTDLILLNKTFGPANLTGQKFAGVLSGLPNSYQFGMVNMTFGFNKFPLDEDRCHLPTFSVLYVRY